jgi:dephospho-CoA kinase
MLTIIGLTGGIASGKSTVAGFIREMGIPVIDADQIAREVVQPGEPAWQDIIARFGEGILAKDQHIDRKLLGGIVFSDPKELQALNQITHPRITALIKHKLDEFVEAGYPLIVLEIPLLFEAHMTHMVDVIWVVTVDRQTQIRRLIGRNQMNVKAAEQRIDAQMPLEEKEQRADLVIYNNDGITDLKAFVEMKIKELLEHESRSTHYGQESNQ